MAHKAIEFTCRNCRRTFESADYGSPLPCPHCGEQFGRITQLDQLLEQWFYPRRWRADLHQPNPYYLLEKLWTANGQGETLYTGIAPEHANYDVFRHLVTRLVAKGVEEGWVELTFPDDPTEENPVYELKFSDPDRFAREVERLFPEVNWDEQIEVPGQPEMASGMPSITSSIDDVTSDEAPEPTPISSARRGRKQ